MKYSIGIDTSNYKTSIALIDSDDNIIYDDRRFLNVKEGERGLRQQDAFFQHVKRLPNMLKGLFDTMREMDIKPDLISVSDKPRNVDGSYMPCFTAGVSIGKTISSTLNIPIMYFSHQDGHIAAGKRFTELRNESDFISFHFSGGTTEALMSKGGATDIIGGTKDISFGQLLDRIGVAMGFGFPAGEEMDYGAIRISSGNLIYSPGDALENVYDQKTLDLIKDLPKTKVNSPYINLSGLETWFQRHIEVSNPSNQEDKDRVSLVLLLEIGNTILKMMEQLSKEYNIDKFLFVGGVSASSFLRSHIERKGKEMGYSVHFASPELASDNAVGIAFSGGDALWL